MGPFSCRLGVLDISQSKQSFLDYDGFVEKFKPRKTTDDCMTPPEVYEAVLSWASERYGFDPADVVRPFWPGGDYEGFDYPEGCVVLDNPPFSKLAAIKRFYLDRGIRFFLFCPSLTALSGKALAMRLTHVICDASVTYENGAVVRTAFVTDMGGDVVLMSAPDLGKLVNAASDRAARRMAPKAQLPKYDYPDAVVTAAMVQRYAKHGVAYEVRRADCCHISALDARRAQGKSVFGGGLLLSERATAERATAERATAERAVAERAAAEKAAAERVHAHVWELSDRERAIQAMLGGD